MLRRLVYEARVGYVHGVGTFHFGFEEVTVATPIREHEGKKYLRRIIPADRTFDDTYVDVYCVLEAFGVTCPATAHAVKKLLCAGQRGKGSRHDDLVGALAALNRAIELEGHRDEKDRETVAGS